MLDHTGRTRAIQRLVGVHVDGVYGPITSRAVYGRLANLSHEETISIDEFDERTRKNLETLRPKAVKRIVPFVRRAIAIAESMGVQAKVIQGFRNKQQQEAAKRRGASKAGWGYSWHNFGIAIDLGLFKGGSYVDSDNPDLAWTIYSAIGEIAPEFNMEWGGSWVSFVDSPHFHLDMGYSTPRAKDRRLLFEGRWEF